MEDPLNKVRITDHTDVVSIDAADLEVVQELDAPLTEWVNVVTFANLKNSIKNDNRVCIFYNREKCHKIIIKMILRISTCL